MAPVACRVYSPPLLAEPAEETPHKPQETEDVSSSERINIVVVCDPEGFAPQIKFM